jgi:hypothetical protein
VRWGEVKTASGYFAYAAATRIALQRFSLLRLGTCGPGLRLVRFEVEHMDVSYSPEVKKLSQRHTLITYIIELIINRN